MSELAISAGAYPAGSILKRARMATGMSVEELSTRIKVREAYIEAVENCDWKRAPERVYLTGYIRQYAEAVGVDPDKALEEYQQTLPEEADPFSSGEFEHIVAKESATITRQVPGLSGWAAAALPALFLAGYAVFAALRPGADAAPVRAAYVTEAPAPPAETAPDASAYYVPVAYTPPAQQAPRNYIVHSDGEAELRVYDKTHKQIESLRLTPNDVQFLSLPEGGYASASGFADGVTVYDEQMQNKIGNIRILLPKD